jgi:hypothetical protein
MICVISVVKKGAIDFQRYYVIKYRSKKGQLI